MTRVWSGKIVLTIAGCMMLLASSSCSRKSSAPQSWTLTVPAAWETQELKMAGLTGKTYLSPLEGAGDIFRENIVVVAEPMHKDLTSQEYYEASLAGAKSLPGFAQGQTGEITIDGQKCNWMDYTQQPGPRKIQARVYFVTHNDVGYTLTCSALPETFAKWQSQFEKAVCTFHVSD